MRLLSALNKICGIVPPLLWAVALAVAGFLWWSVSGALDAESTAHGVTKAKLQRQSGAIEQQKREASARLATLTAEVATLQAAMNERHRAQEIKDGNAKATIDRLRADLRGMSRAGGGGGLRDPHATACRAGGGGGATEGAAAAGAGGGAGDPPEAGGLLSAPLEGLLLELQLEADAINRAYRVCRPDAMNIRGLAPLPQPD